MERCSVCYCKQFPSIHKLLLPYLISDLSKIILSYLPDPDQCVRCGNIDTITVCPNCKYKNSDITAFRLIDIWQLTCGKCQVMWGSKERPARPTGPRYSSFIWSWDYIKLLLWDWPKF